MTTRTEHEICPGVADLVRALQAADFLTCDSGDGSHYENGMPCALPYAHVVMVVAACDATLELERLRRFMLTRPERAWEVEMAEPEQGDDFRILVVSEPNWRAKYDAAFPEGQEL